MNQQLFIQDLNLHLQGEVLSDDHSLGVYATDASVYQIRPIAVVLPKHEADVIKALEIAKDHRVTVLPRGGGTSLAGQTVGESMVLDFSKYMNQVLEFNPEEQWVRVQPGLVRDELNAFLKSHQLIFAPDPATSSRANVGGMIGNNSSGTKSILYGKTVDHVLELKVALADGTILNLKACSQAEWDQKSQADSVEGKIYREFRCIITDNAEEIEKRFPKVMRRVQGYNLDEFVHQDNWNLAKLICGSEGTLATILEAKVNLEKLPAYKSVCVVHFEQILEAITAVNHMLPFRPSAIEILDETVVDLSRKNLTTQRSCHFIEGNPAAIQIVEFYGESPEDVLERPRQMVEKLKELGLGYAYPIFPEGNEYADVWLIRKKGLGLMLGLKGDKKPLPFIEDAGIPTEVLPEYIDRVLKVCKKHGTDAAMYAHASVGVIHVRPILDLRQEIDIERFKHIAAETFELVKEYGGSWSGEHGDGLVRSYFLPEYFGPQVYGALKKIKQLFDPENRMNPGKIIDSGPIDQHLRYGTRYQDQQIETVFQFQEDGSFTNAVHMCTGVGECRKMLGGTMCPSFKATRDEAHSTRGRANALRLAMSGQLGEAGLTDPQLHEILDLCLSCKACKSECPSNVDMAKLKSEVWQKKYDKHGPDLRERFIRDSAAMAARFSGWKASFINAIQKTQAFRKPLESFAGIASQRVLPDFAPQSFADWFHKNYQSSEQETKTVILFADTYLNYHEPEIGKKTVRLLQALGYRVELAEAGCCQRPRISNGFLKLAKKDGSQTAKNLQAYLDKGLKVVVCEPSCTSALQDDLPDLIEDAELAGNLKKQVYNLEGFLSEEIDNGHISKKIKTTENPIYLHGHCHQKAIYGTKALHHVFEALAHTRIQEIPSGCCGMAGSFGYEKEHYAISKKIGEQVLFPAIEQTEKQARIIANGFSCRHQIDHFTSRSAHHWVEYFQLP